jgi:hypothetical protein
MDHDPLEIPVNPEEAIPEQLFRHTKRPEWGMALLAWERKGRRAYQFEDGTLRKIQEGYYELLGPVEEFDGPTEAVRANLQAAVSARRGGWHQEIQEAVCTFDDQIGVFVRAYPKGFEDEAWISDHRGLEGARSLKRHRDASIQQAQEIFDPARIKPLIEKGKYSEVLASILELLSSTDLVPMAHVKQLRALDDEGVAEYARAAVDLVTGEEPVDERYKEFLRTLTQLLGARPTWGVATVLLALTNPQDHVSVRRSSFLRQAGSISPTGNYTLKPTLPSYQSFRRVALGVRKRLQAEGHEPRDLLDVHDFVGMTLKKSALEQMDANK